MNCVDPDGKDGYWAEVGGVFKGYGQAIWGTIRSPYDLAVLAGTAAGSTDPSGVLSSSLSGAWSQFSSGITGERGSEGFGESFGQILIVVGTSGAGFAEGGAFSNVKYVTRWDTPSGISSINSVGYIKKGAFVQRGKGNIAEYLLSGAAQKGYKFKNKVTTLTSKRNLGPPPGAEKFKAAIGQRTAKDNIRIRQ